MGDKKILKVAEIGIFLLFLIALGWVGAFGWALKNYLSLSGITPVKDIEWKVMGTEETPYDVEVYYTYEVEGTRYNHREMVDVPSFPNKKAAESFVAASTKKSWEAWYDKKKPRTSTLQRYFPFKAFFRALISLLVALYFYVLWNRFSAKDKP